jgi:hypothetical protein
MQYAPFLKSLFAVIRLNTLGEDPGKAGEQPQGTAAFLFDLLEDHAPAN